jgi:hypothetical protein
MRLSAYHPMYKITSFLQRNVATNYLTNTHYSISSSSSSSSSSAFGAVTLVGFGLLNYR